MPKSITKERRLLIWEKYKGRCAYCGNKIELRLMHVDHIVPLYRKWSQKELDEYGIVKGTNKIDNLNPSCATCNISKSTLTLEQWREQIILKIERLRTTVTNFRLLESYGIVKVIKNKEVVFYFEKGGRNGRR